MQSPSCLPTPPRRKTEIEKETPRRGRPTHAVVGCASCRDPHVAPLLLILLFSFSPCCPLSHSITHSLALNRSCTARDCTHTLSLSQNRTERPAVRSSNTSVNPIPIFLIPIIFIFIVLLVPNSDFYLALLYPIIASENFFFFLSELFWKHVSGYMCETGDLTNFCYCEN